MAGRVLSAAVGSLLVLVALLTAVHKCQCPRPHSAKVIPERYTILSAAVYEDPACDPPSSSKRASPNSQVTCSPMKGSGTATVQATDATPRLTDGVLGPDYLTNSTTKYAYTLAGSSQYGTFESWIRFNFTSHVPMVSVTLHYYCTGQPPQLQLSDGSGVVAPAVSQPCGNTSQRQCFTFSFNIPRSTLLFLQVLRNSNTMYISEVKFFKGKIHNTNCCIIMDMPTATSSSAHYGPLSTDHITSTLTSIRITAIATPETISTRPSSTDNTSASGLPSNNSSAVAGNFSAVAGAVAGVVAGLVVCIAVAVLLIIVCFIFKRNRNLQNNYGPEKSIDNPVYHTTAENKISPEQPEETYITPHNPGPRYETGNDPKEPTDHHYTAADDRHYDAVNKDSRMSPSTGQSTHLTSPAAYDEIETSTNTYSVPISDTYTGPVNQTQNGRRVGDRAVMELEGGGSEKGDATAGAVYAVVDKTRKEGGRAMASSKEELPATAGAVYSVADKERQEKHRTNTTSEESGAELEKSAAIAGVVYAVVEKKKETPPPLPPPYQPGD